MPEKLATVNAAIPKIKRFKSFSFYLLIMLLKRFAVGSSSYIYDARTNIIMKVNSDLSDAELYKAVDEKYRQKYGPDVLGNFKGIKKMGFPLSDIEIVDKVDNEMKELLLGVTEQCNLRCGYCIYSGNYVFERTHGSKSMDEKTMKKAVDLFFLHNVRNNPVYVGFYGGEPLLEYDLIREAVDYSKRKSDKQIVFSMTTNGLLLNDERARFIANNDFNLMVSLDGPKHIHDRNRRTDCDTPTHNTVTDNLKELREYAPKYYESIGFQATLNDPLELPEVGEFFDSNELTKKHRVVISFVNPYDTTFPITKRTDEDMEKMWQKLGDRHAESILRMTEFSPFIQRLFDLDMKRIYERRIEWMPSEMSLKGACVPSARKAFVTTDGDIHICERVGKAFKVGTVDEGIDKKKVLKMVKDYDELTSEDCPECWAVRLCGPCHAYFRENDDLSAERKESMCSSLQGSIEHALYVYTKVSEDDKTAIPEYFRRYPELA